MIILGIILLIIGYLVPHLYVLADIGWVFVIVGVLLLLLGAVGRPVRGRRNWF